MRLIHTDTLELVEFWGNDIPKYAILSHTWGREEVTFKDWKRLEAAKEKEGFSKIEMACRQAREDGLQYLWVDTNCIDKRSSAELSEAINSMFSWYQKASVCYAYLADVEPRLSLTTREDRDDYLGDFRRSRWFTRGWTLQELLAPLQMVFYAKDWSKIDPRDKLADDISRATKIPAKYLLPRSMAVSHASVAQRMSWLSCRETTRVEDMAYCMLGILEINMPLLYGEGSKAFTRLQEEIIRTSTDHTIFCWTWTEEVPLGWTSLLAPFPHAFKDSGGFIRSRQNVSDLQAFTMTNAGLSIRLPVIQAFSYLFGVLNATHLKDDVRGSYKRFACVPITRCLYEEGHPGTRQVMRRITFPPIPLLMPPSWAVGRSSLYIQSYNPGSDIYALFNERNPRQSGRSFLLLFGAAHSISGPGRLVQETRDWTSFSSVLDLENDQKSVGIVIFPWEKFDRDRGSITLAKGSETDGALIRVDSSESSSLIFLGANSRPSYTGPRSFGKIIAHKSSFASDLGPILLNLIQDLSTQETLIGVTAATQTEPSTESEVGLSLADEILFDNGFISPVFITYPERSSDEDEDSDGERQEEGIVMPKDHKCSCSRDNDWFR